MRNIGDSSYPNLGTFKDALDIAQEAIDKFGGIIPNDKAAEKLGYKIKNPKKISGPIFERLKDLTMFGLFEKIRGGYKTTGLAEKALDPYDSANSSAGRAEAIRNIPIMERAFTEWNGEIPSETAFPAKLQGLIGDISWKEAQNQTGSLRKLFIEGFSYLKPAPELTGGESDRTGLGGETMEPERELGRMTISARGKGFGFTKTLPFTSKGVETLRKLIDFLETQVEEEETEESLDGEQQTD